MNDDRMQPQFSVDEAEVFEQQLRALTPRDANFRLPVPDSRESSVAAMRSLNSLPPRNPRASVAVLIATWSIGVAAGVASTLLYSRLGTTPMRPETVSISHELANPIIEPSPVDGGLKETIATLVDTNKRDDVSVKSTSRGELQPEGTASNFPSLSPWSFLAVAPRQSSEGVEMLTSRSFTADLALDSFRNGNIRIGSVSKQSSKIPDTETFEAAKVISIFPPENVELKPPMNQRALLRNLLQI